MPISQNNWPAAENRNAIGVKTFAVPGRPDVLLPVRADIAPLLLEMARWWNTWEPLMVPGCWGYAYRSVRGQATGLSNHASGTACFGGDTEILTYEGPRRIGDLAGTTVRVLTRDPVAGKRGRWVDAPIRSFGEQETFPVALSRHGRQQVVWATGDHRWFVRRPTRITYSESGRSRKAIRPRVHEVTTAGLTPDDVLLSCRPLSEASRCQPAPIGVAHGVVFGDGTVQRTSGASVCLYGPKVELLRFFPEPRTHSYSTPTGSVELRVDNLPHHFKRLPDITESTGYLLGWLAGYVATDGHVTSRGGSVSLSTADEDSALFVRDLCARLGIGCSVTARKRGEASYKPGVDYIVAFVRSDLSPEFFVRSDQREAFGHAVREPADWKVDSVGQAGIVQMVYCATVPTTGAFALDQHILTGNCDFNAPRHPLGAVGTLGIHKDAVIAKAASLGLRSGASYSGRKDEMHVEINVSPAEAMAIVARLQAPPPTTKPTGRPTIQRGSTGDAVKLAQRWFGLTADGVFGPATDAKVRWYQRMKGLAADGIVGPRTWAAMGL